MKKKYSLSILIVVMNLFISPLLAQRISPSNWSFWSESSLRASFGLSSDPISHVGLSVYNDKQWSITSNTVISVSPGEVWTFSAVISGRFLKELSVGGSAYMGIVSYNNQTIADWNAVMNALPQGSFGWTKVSIQYTVPVLGVNKIQPRFFGVSGGGELYIFDAVMSKSGETASLVPAANIPKARASTMSIIAKPNNNDSSLPVGWDPWHQSSLRASSGFYNYPVPHLEVRTYNDQQWALNANVFDVQPGETWTFTAVVSGRLLGDLSANGGGYISLIALNGSGVVNWMPAATFLPQGTFAWTKVSVQYTVPSNGSVTKLQPRFFGNHGGGELYISDASFLPSTNQASLVVAASKIPDSKVNISPYINNAAINTSIPQVESNWTVWSETNGAAISLPATPYNKLELVNNVTNKTWALSSKVFEVVPGEVWTFNTTFWTNPTSSNLSCYMGIVALNSQKQIVNWNAVMSELLTPIVGLNKASLAYQIPNDGSVAFIQPRFFANNWTGTLSIVDAIMLPANKVITQFNTVKTTPTISINKTHGIFLPGEQIQWTVGTDNGLSNSSLKYQILDAYGNIINDGIGSGILTLGGTVSYTPQSPGYYELKIFGTATQNSDQIFVEGKSSAIVVVNANSAFGSNPFSIQGVPDYSFYSLLGLTWDRPLVYNIKYVDTPNNPLYKQLPTDFPDYALAWNSYASNSSKPYNDPKFINCYEIWNEPVNEGAIPPTFTQLACQPFIDMLQATSQGLSGTGKKILLGLEHPGYYQAFNTYTSSSSSLATNFYNILATHPYTRALWDGYSLCPEGGYGEITLSELDQEGNHIIIDRNGYGLLSDLASYKQHSSGKPLWSTEFGWPTHSNHSFSTTELNQARYIVRSSLLQLSSGYEKISAFRWSEVSFWGDLDGSYGLARLDLSPKPAICAFSVLARTIHNLDYYGYIPRPVNEGVFVFGEDVRVSDKKTILVLWRPDMEKTVQINLPSGSKTIVDMFGREYTTSLPITELSIGRSPLYVIIHNKNPNEFLSGSVIQQAPPSSIFNVSKGY